MRKHFITAITLASCLVALAACDDNKAAKPDKPAADNAASQPAAKAPTPPAEVEPAKAPVEEPAANEADSDDSDDSDDSADIE